ncbi:TPA: DUF1642 domain-containing protein [Enterococcus faecium 1,230,933]
MDELITKVEQWAKDKGLDQAQSSKQMLKTVEEVGEVAAALARKDEHGLRDGIGDVVVTLIILAMQNDMDLYECLNQAYNEIKGRTGKMVDGVFVKSSDLKQLDEPQKPVVPKFVAEWFEENRHALDLAIFIAIRGLDEEEWPHKTDFENWLDVSKNKPIETLIRMIDGYEVEKEPLYYVELPVVYFNHLDLETYLMKDDRGNITIADNNDFDDMKFTEAEIKAIDERYWPFAVPVEEVAEG